MNPKQIKATIDKLDQQMTSSPRGVFHPVDTRDCTCPACVRKPVRR